MHSLLNKTLADEPVLHYIKVKFKRLTELCFIFIGMALFIKLMSRFFYKSHHLIL